MADRQEAQKKRAQARQRRRQSAEDERQNGTAENERPAHDDGEPLEAVKRAAKVAAASAAVGATAAAARALSHRGEDEPEPADAADAEAPAEPQAFEDEDDQEQTAARPEPRREERPGGAAPDEAQTTVQRASEQLEALLGREVESVSALERTSDGWLATLEVVEVSRIPESTDVLASFEMELDDDLNLRRYARVRRYHRSQADRGEQ